MYLKYLKHISLLKSSGIKKYITINIFPTECRVNAIKRTERFYNIRNNINLSDLKVEHSFTIEHYEDFSNIAARIGSFIKENNWSDAVLIIGINEFRFSTVTIPTDIEEIELWFLENTSMFLPDSQKADQFIYAYEKYKEDENYRYFFVSIVRRNALKKIFDAINSLGIRIINCSPFIFSMISIHKKNENNSLIINVEKDRLFSLLITNSENIFYNEFYFNLTEDFKYETEIKRYVNQLYEYFTANLKISINTADIHIAGCQDLLAIADSTIAKTFNQEKGYENISGSLPSILIIKKVIENYDEVINFIKEDELVKIRSHIEKNIALRYLLTNAALIFLLVFTSSLSDTYLNNISSHKEESLIGMRTITGKVKKTKKENKDLRKNLAVLKKLKSNRIKESKLLGEIPELLNEKTYLISLQTKKSKDKTNIELQGLSFSQKDIAAFIGQIENSRHFKNVSLLYSSITENYKKNNKMVQFKLSADFNDF